MILSDIVICDFLAEKTSHEEDNSLGVGRDVIAEFYVFFSRRIEMIKKSGVVLVVLLHAFNVSAADGSTSVVDAKKFYFGGGLGFNSLSGIDLSDGQGLQVFAGYELPVNMTEGTLSIEAGYMDSGDMDARVNISGLGTSAGEADAEGIWVNAVVDFPLRDKLSVVGRVGLDLGDDDGLMLGGGLGFQINEKIDVRAEYVIRDHVDSLQFNLVIRQ